MWIIIRIVIIYFVFEITNFGIQDWEGWVIAGLIMLYGMIRKYEDRF